MPITINRELAALAAEVDRLGREGKTQDEIAVALGRRDKWQLRRELESAGLKLAYTNCVWSPMSEKALADLLESGEVVVAEGATA